MSAIVSLSQNFKGGYPRAGMLREIKAVFYELFSSSEVIESSGALVPLTKLSTLCLNHHICRKDRIDELVFRV